MFSNDKESHKLLERILEELVRIRKELAPRSMQINFLDENGEPMSAPAVSLNLDGTASVTATVTEVFNGGPYTPVPTDLTWSVQNGTIVSLQQNADGSCLFKPLALGSTQIGCSDKTTGNSAVANITVVPGPTPNSMTIVFGPVTA